MFVVCCLLFVKSAYAVRPTTHVHYVMNKSTETYWNMDMYITWEVAPPSGNIFPAFQVFFENNIPAYIGIQQYGTNKKAGFAFWDSATGSNTATSTYPGCSRFTHECSGTSCWTNYQWVTGREYRLRFWSLAVSANGEKWGAWIKDMSTGIETKLGEIDVKNSNGKIGYGRMKTALSWQEYYAGSDSCYGQPYSRVVFRGPYANNYSAFAKTANYPYFDTHPCQTALASSRGQLSSAIEAGDSVNRGGIDNRMLWQIYGISTTNFNTNIDVIDPVLLDKYSPSKSFQ